MLPKPLIRLVALFLIPSMMLSQRPGWAAAINLKSPPYMSAVLFDIRAFALPMVGAGGTEPLENQLERIREVEAAAEISRGPVRAGEGGRPQDERDGRVWPLRPVVIERAVQLLEEHGLFPSMTHVEAVLGYLGTSLFETFRRRGWKQSQFHIVQGSHLFGEPKSDLAKDLEDFVRGGGVLTDEHVITEPWKKYFRDRTSDDEYWRERFDNLKKLDAIHRQLAREVSKGAAEELSLLLRKNPQLRVDQIAKRLGISRKEVRRLIGENFRPLQGVAARQAAVDSALDFAFSKPLRNRRFVPLRLAEVLRRLNRLSVNEFLVAAAVATHSPLTPRDQLLRLRLIQGETGDAIAQEVELSLDSVGDLLVFLLAQLGVFSPPQAETNPQKRTPSGPKPDDSGRRSIFPGSETYETKVAPFWESFLLLPALSIWTSEFVLHHLARSSLFLNDFGQVLETQAIFFVVSGLISVGLFWALHHLIYKVLARFFPKWVEGRDPPRLVFWEKDPPYGLVSAWLISALLAGVGGAGISAVMGPSLLTRFALVVFDGFAFGFVHTTLHYIPNTTRPSPEHWSLVPARQVRRLEELKRVVDADPRAVISRLSVQEQETLSLLLQGKTSAENAEKQGLQSVRNILTHIYEKLLPRWQGPRSGQSTPLGPKLRSMRRWSTKKLLTEAEESALNKLSPRERQLRLLVLQEKTNDAIAQELGLSPNTVNSCLVYVLAKLSAFSTPPSETIPHKRLPATAA